MPRRTAVRHQRARRTSDARLDQHLPTPGSEASSALRRRPAALRGYPRSGLDTASRECTSRLLTELSQRWHRSQDWRNRAAHQHGGVRSRHAVPASACAASTWAASETAASPRRRVRAASITPTGRSVGVQWVGSETAGLPVTFHIEVYGVNRFCASKSAAGSASSRIAPTGSGGAASVGRQHRVVRRERGQRPRRRPGAARRSPARTPARSPRSPRSESHVVSGRSSARSSVGRLTHGERGQHRPAGLEDGYGVRAAAAPRRPRPRGRATPAAGWRPPRPRRHSGSIVDVGDHRAARSGRPAAVRAPGRRRRGTSPRARAPRTGRPTARPAITSSKAAASRTVRARAPLVARPIGSPYIGAPRDPAPRRLQPDDPAAARRDPDRAAAVGALRDRYQPGRTAAAEPPLDPPAIRVGVPRRHRRRRALGLGVAGRPELRGARLAEADHPRRLDPADDLVVKSRHEVGEHGRPEAGADALGRVEVLDRGGYAGQRTVPPTAEAARAWLGGDGHEGPELLGRAGRSARGSARPARGWTSRPRGSRRPAPARSGRAARSWSATLPALTLTPGARRRSAAGVRTRTAWADDLRRPAPWSSRGRPRPAELADANLARNRDVGGVHLACRPGRGASRAGRVDARHSVDTAAGASSCSRTRWHSSPWIRVTAPAHDRRRCGGARPGTTTALRCDGRRGHPDDDRRRDAVGDAHVHLQEVVCLHLLVRHAGSGGARDQRHRDQRPPRGASSRGVRPRGSDCTRGLVTRHLGPALGSGPGRSGRQWWPWVLRRCSRLLPHRPATRARFDGSRTPRRRDGASADGRCAPPAPAAGPASPAPPRDATLRRRACAGRT